LINLTLRNATSCAPCARAKAACKPFNADRAWRKAKDKIVRRAQTRKTKQWTDVEWKEQVLEKLGKIDKLVVQVRRYHKWSLTICDRCFDTLKSSKM